MTISLQFKFDSPRRRYVWKNADNHNHKHRLGGKPAWQGIKMDKRGLKYIMKTTSFTGYMENLHIKSGLKMDESGS